MNNIDSNSIENGYERSTEIVMEALGTEITNLVNSDPETYGRHTFVLTMERQIIKHKDRKPNTIYLVVKFLQSNRDHGQQIQPITINALSEHNSIDVCHKFMTDFSAEFNLVAFEKGDYSIRQTVTSPTAINAFNEVYDGYRSLFYISGTFLIGKNSNPITGIAISWGDQEEEVIDFLNASWAYDAQIDSQPFYGTNNYNLSVAKTATLSVSFSLYMIGSAFCDKILSSVFNEDNEAVVNERYSVRVTFKSGKQFTIPMRMSHTSGTQQIRDFPAITVAMVR